MNTCLRGSNNIPLQRPGNIKFGNKYQFFPKNERDIRSKPIICLRHRLRCFSQPRPTRHPRLLTHFQSRIVRLCPCPHEFARPGTQTKRPGDAGPLQDGTRQFRYLFSRFAISVFASPPARFPVLPRGHRSGSVRHEHARRRCRSARENSTRRPARDGRHVG